MPESLPTAAGHEEGDPADFRGVVGDVRKYIFNRAACA
jgi:hypothetical protein